eukprot:1608728-Prymnesium_polylepis.1
MAEGAARVIAARPPPPPPSRQASAKDKWPQPVVQPPEVQVPMTPPTPNSSEPPSPADSLMIASFAALSEASDREGCFSGRSGGG